MNVKKLARKCAQQVIDWAKQVSKFTSKYWKYLRFFPFMSLSKAVLDAIASLDVKDKAGRMKRIKKFSIIGGSLFVTGITFGWIAFPKILKSQIKSQVALKPGSEMRELWSAFPLPLDFKIYLFNVTNPLEITAGAKPILREIGPYFFDEYKSKLDMVDRDSDDSLEYTRKDTWFFNPSKSHGLTGEETIVFPHLLIWGMVMATLKDKPTAIGIVSKAVDSIFKKPETAFVTARAMDIMFDGLPIDCTVKDFAGSAVCSILKTEAKDLREVAENQYKFSLFGHKNDTPQPDRIRVLRGIKNYKDLGRVIEWNNQPALTIWPEDHCNAYNGTDSTIFPPLMTSEDDIVSFTPELCRSLSAWYQHPSKVKGVNTYRYIADLGDMSKNEREKCFCPTPETCLGRNLYDLTKCVGIPIIASLPNLYDSEKKYHEMVDGLHPTRELHEINMDFEPMTATPIEGRKRLQFNMFVFPIEKFRLMKTFPEVLFPLFWIEEGILLDDMFVKKVKQAFLVITIVTWIKWLMVFGGIGCGGYAAFLKFKNRGNEQKLDITKVTPQSGSRKDSGQEKKWPTMNISTIQAATVPPNLDRN